MNDDNPPQWPGGRAGPPVPPFPPAPPGAADAAPEWFDDEAGPLVRLYAMTAGRARPTSEAFDLIAVVHAERTGDDVPPPTTPEQTAILGLCRNAPRSVADIAADSDLPVGVVRVLLGDLLDAGHIGVSRPVPPAELPDAGILREVINGLRAL